MESTAARRTRLGASERASLNILAGLALICLTTYTSILSYALRQYSRSQLLGRLGEARRQRWLPWLDEYSSELALTASFARIVSILSTITCGYALYLLDGASPDRMPAFLRATGLNLGLLAVFAVGIPHAVAVYVGEAVLARSLPVLWVMRVAFYPVERVLLAIDFVVRRLLGKPETGPDEESERVEQEILDAVSEGEAHGAVDEEQKQMIRSILELHETTVSAIMTPRTDIVAVPVDATPEEVRETVVHAGHSRIPVYEKSLDHIIGVLYAKDLLKHPPGSDFRVRDVMRPALYVPETKSVEELLRELRQARVHIAIVLDEYGGTAGLVSFEDILEELVGEIDDEYDTSPPPAIRRVDSDTLEVDGRVHVREINEALDIRLPEDDDYETIAGFVFSTLGRIPETGEEFTHENLHFVITAAEPRKINRLRIHVLRPVRTS